MDLSNTLFDLLNDRAHDIVLRYGQKVIARLCLQSRVVASGKPTLCTILQFCEIFVKCKKFPNRGGRPNFMNRHSSQRRHKSVDHRLVVMIGVNVHPSRVRGKDSVYLGCKIPSALRDCIKGGAPLLHYFPSHFKLKLLCPCSLALTKEIGGHDCANRAESLYPGCPRSPCAAGFVRVVHKKHRHKQAYPHDRQNHTTGEFAFFHSILHELWFYEYSPAREGRLNRQPGLFTKRDTRTRIERGPDRTAFSLQKINAQPRRPAQCYPQENGSLRRTSLSRISSAWMYSGWSADTSQELRDNADSGCFRLTMNSISKKETVALVSQCVRGGQPFRHRDRQITKIAVMASALRASRTETFGNPCDGL